MPRDRGVNTAVSNLDAPNNWLLEMPLPRQRLQLHSPAGIFANLPPAGLHLRPLPMPMLATRKRPQALRKVHMRSKSTKIYFARAGKHG